MVRLLCDADRALLEAFTIPTPPSHRAPSPSNAPSHAHPSLSLTAPSPPPKAFIGSRSDPSTVPPTLGLSDLLSTVLQLAPSDMVVLKLDVEGYEYDIVSTLLNDGVRAAGDRNGVGRVGEGWQVAFQCGNGRSLARLSTPAQTVGSGGWGESVRTLKLGRTPSLTRRG